jgi:hypothetical protein
MHIGYTGFITRMEKSLKCIDYLHNYIPQLEIIKGLLKAKDNSILI